MPLGVAMDAKGNIIKVGDRVRGPRGYARIALIERATDSDARKVWFAGNAPGDMYYALAMHINA